MVMKYSFSSINLLILAVISLLSFSCTESNVSMTTTEYVIGGIELKVYNIGGCEYIGDLDRGQGYYFLTHKGNCNNPIHKCGE